MSVATRTERQLLSIDRFETVIEDGFNRGDLAVLDALFHPEFVEHQRGFPTPDLAGLKRGMAALRAAIPDIHLVIADTIVEDDKVCFVLEGTGTHQGMAGPFPASGNALSWQVIDICRCQEGQIIEHLGIPDQMAITEQIGMPRPPRWLMRLLMRRGRR